MLSIRSWRIFVMIAKVTLLVDSTKLDRIFRPRRARPVGIGTSTGRARAGVWTGAVAAQRPKAGKLDDEFAAWSSSM